jgi:hypothetical protein
LFHFIINQIAKKEIVNYEEFLAQFYANYETSYNIADSEPASHKLMHNLEVFVAV